MERSGFWVHNIFISVAPFFVITAGDLLTGTWTLEDEDPATQATE